MERKREEISRVTKGYQDTGSLKERPRNKIGIKSPKYG